MSYVMELREATLDSVEGQPIESKARALNMIEAIIEGEMSVEEILEGIGSDTLPKIYVPISHNKEINRT